MLSHVSSTAQPIVFLSKSSNSESRVQNLLELRKCISHETKKSKSLCNLLFTARLLLLLW